jgi:hypothetical protein
MRVFGVGAAVLLLVAMACGGEEFSSNDQDASLTGGGGLLAGTPTVGSGGSGGSTGGNGGAGTGSGGMSGMRDGGSDARGGGGGGGAGGGPKNSGDCLTSIDCGGDACVELFPGGYRVCATKVPEATTCSMPLGQCCKSSDCGVDARPPGKCILGPVEPSCGGPAPPLPSNVCASDACMSAADCAGANAICTPAGTLGRKVARCMTAGCRLDGDCTAQPGGICVPIASSCCAEAVGLFCIYQDGCRSNRDCMTGEHCATDATHAYCAPGIPPCPAVP